MTLGFVLLRLTNFYGNPPALPGGVTPGDWHMQASFAKTVILFFDTEKYPPSLQFLLMTLGPSLVLLRWLDGKKIAKLWQPITVFGRVPMFFYLLHLYLIHVMAVGVALIWHQPYQWLLHGAFWLNELPEGYGHDLPFIYGMWLLAVVVLYFPCAWYARVKKEQAKWWMSYL